MTVTLSCPVNSPIVTVHQRFDGIVFRHCPFIGCGEHREEVKFIEYQE